MRDRGAFPVRCAYARVGAGGGSAGHGARAASEAKVAYDHASLGLLRRVLRVEGACPEGACSLGLGLGFGVGVGHGGRAASEAKTTLGKRVAYDHA